MTSRAAETPRAAKGSTVEKGEGPRSADGRPGAAGNVPDAVQQCAATGHSPAGAQGQPRGKSKRRRRRGKRRPVYARNSQTPAELSGPAIASPPIQAAPPIHAAASASNGVPQSPSAGPLAPSQRYYAALDLGTNNCRLLVAVPREQGFRVVDAFSRVVRLGEGLGHSGRLSEAAMDRAIGALAACRAKLDDRRVVRSRLIATEACRVAANGAEFLERVRAQTGLELEVVTQKAESRLAVAGCASLIDNQSSGALLFDIGGGSSELVWIDLTRPVRPGTAMADRIRAWVSLPLGVVTLSERHGDKVTPEVYAAMVGEAAALLERFPQADELSKAVAAGGIHMLGTSGTITTLASVHLDLPRYDRRRVDGMWMDRGDVSSIIARLLAAEGSGQLAHPSIGRERADLVMAGCAILQALIERWPCQLLRVADRGLREGMLVDLMEADKASGAMWESVAHG